MSQRERLGVLGGTFDPLHLGHFRAAESVREAMSLDRILFVPARIPPHKARACMAPAEDRYRMIRAAVENEPRFEVSRLEVDREGPSYTVDTLRALGKGRPDAEIFFITGIDSFCDIRTWMRWEELLQSFPFVVHGRPGSDLMKARDALPEHMRSILVTLREDAPPPSHVGRGSVVYLTSIVTLDVSSTNVRAMVREGRSIRFLVPAAVETYIQSHQLYREGD